MSNLSPKSFGIILDTHIVVSILNYEYNNLIDIIKDEQIFILICEELRKEYLRQITKQSSSGYWILYHFLEKLQEINKVIIENQPITTAENKITNRKDQVHVDCAICSSSKAWIIVTNDQYDFTWEKNSPPIPIIVNYEEFSNKNKRQNIISQCKTFSFYPTN